jgi:molybdate transport system permease protein
MPLTQEDFLAIRLTIELAALSTLILLLIGTPIACGCRAPAPG